MFARRTIAILTTAGAVMTVGLSAAPANAAIGPLTANLTVTRNITIYNVKISGVVKMTQAEAQSLIASGHKVVWRLWGEDPVFDDFLFGPDPTSRELTATPQGLAFEGLRGASGSVLDEDPEGRDELYAGVRLVTSTSFVNGQLRHGATVRSGESNRFWHSF